MTKRIDCSNFQVANDVGMKAEDEITASFNSCYPNSAMTSRQLGKPRNHPDWDIYVLIQGLNDTIESKCETHYDTNICLEWHKIIEVPFEALLASKPVTLIRKTHEPSGLYHTKADIGVHTLDNGKFVIIYLMDVMLKLIKMRAANMCRELDFFEFHKEFRNSNPPVGGYIASYEKLIALKNVEIAQILD